MHLRLSHFVSTRPHSSRLRKRAPRRLRAVRPSRGNELWYKAELLTLVRHLRQTLRAEAFPELRSYVDSRPQIQDRRMVGDTIPVSVLQSALNKAKRVFGGIDTLAARLAGQAVQRSVTAVDDRLAASIRWSVGVDIRAALTAAGPIQFAMRTALAANVELITSIPQQYFARIAESVRETVEEGIRWEDLAKELERIGDVTESRAKLIARDQVSKMNSSMNEVRQTSLGIESYEWAAAMDERTRDTHADNDGEIFRWDTPPDTGHPGFEVSCRCTAIPLLNLDELEAEAVS